MECVKNSKFYKEAIQEVNLPFGNFYLFDGYIIGEINEGVVFSWDDHAKKLAEQFSDLYSDNGNGLVYITNRVNQYSVMPTDWIKFYKNSYKLKGYGVVSYTSKGHVNALLEKLFMKNILETFNDLETAINWAKSLP